MEYLKAHYDRILPAVAGVALLIVAIWSIFGLAGLPETFLTPATVVSGAPHEADPTVLQLKDEAAKLSEPSSAMWAEDERLLFVSRVYLLSGGKLIDIVDSDSQLSPGIPNAWILQHQLDYTDPRLATQDPDEDGFSNLEEYIAGTKPRDATSTPPFWTKLRVKSFEKIPFRIKFMGAPSLRPGEPFAADTEFSINTLDYSSPTQFLRLGDKIAGTDLEIVKAESKTATNEVGSVVDISELTVKDKATGDEIILVTEKEVDSPYSYALLVNTITAEEIRIEKGKTFTLRADGTDYKLIDVAAEGAVLSPSDSDEERLSVPPLETTEPVAPQPSS